MAKVSNSDRLQILLAQSKLRWTKNINKGNPEFTNLKDLILAKVTKIAGGCWEWNGAKTGKGYGQIYWDGRDQRAHRLAYTFFVGPIRDLHVLHKCNNPSCVNPGHLYLGTNQQNVNDREAAGNGIFQKGHIPKNGLIDLERARNIKDYIAVYHPPVTLKDIAILFGVPEQMVRDIKHGRSYINA